ncbi:MAG: tRNA 2-thiouridine(34) synthase MnmA [Coprothermobacter sp.]|jgi:tRNA-specific 2-thiouridylase|nr:tRNA 2-thiouridine(34) synthase MnmA [Coprothermobacter sp.]
MSVVVGMSGGVDSAVSALLLKELGEDVIGVTLHFSQHSACCDISSTRRAKAQCEHLGIAWHNVDVRDAFDCQVVQPFWQAIAGGATPNPCVFCNERVKWQGLLDVADELHADLIASGHYAGIIHSGDGDQICRGMDRAKDQSYFLYRLSAEQRRRVMFPLAGRVKREVVALASRWFNPDLLASRESQDLCFVEGPVGVEARRRLPCVPGDVVLTNGTVIGKHQGLASYTVGQRSGLGISAASRLYVVEKRHVTNQLVVGLRSACMRDVFEAIDLKWHHLPTGKSRHFSADVVTRYRSKPVKGSIDRVSEDRVSIHLADSLFAVTPGQAVVFYDDRCILGGGTIV